MPIINLKTSHALTESDKQAIASRLTEITSELLRKNPAITLVNIDDAVRTWFLNSEENREVGVLQGI